MQGPDMDLIKEIPGYKIIMKAVLKHQIQLLVEQLADTTDEESILLTASVSDGTLSHLGTESGKNFLDGHEEIKSQFLGFVLKSHHTVKKKSSEKHFASGPGRKSSTQQSMPLVFDTDSEDTFSEASIHTESQLQIMSEPVITSPRPVSLTRNSQATKSKATASNIKNRPRRSAEAKRSPFKSNIYVDEDINLEENNDEDNSDNATITKHETDETKPDIKYTQTVSASAILPLVSDLDTGNQGLGENSEESAAIESVLDDTVVVKMEAVSDHEGGNVDTDDPDWEPGAKKRRKSSGSRSLASPRDTSLNQSGQSFEPSESCPDAAESSFPPKAELAKHVSEDLSEEFKPASGSWSCDLCMVLNKPETGQCDACETPRQVKGKAVSGSQPGEAEEQSWTCERCMVLNEGETTACAACQADRTDWPGVKVAKNRPPADWSRDTTGKDEHASFWPSSSSGKDQPISDWPSGMTETDPSTSYWPPFTDEKDQPSTNWAGFIPGKGEPATNWSPFTNGKDEPSSNWPGMNTGQDQGAVEMPTASTRKGKKKGSGKRHLCTICGNTFERPSKLKIHHRIHSGEHPFPCEICGKQFNQKNNLKIHMLQHTDKHGPEKPHTCHLCGCAFDRPSKLQVHLRIHSGDRPFKCEFCGKQFNQKNNLKTHIYRRHKNQAFS